MSQNQKPALPEKWITPIRLAIVLVLAACSAYIFFNVRDLKFTHYIVLMTIAVVCSMAWLDCKMSLRYWQEQQRREKNSLSTANSENMNSSE